MRPILSLFHCDSSEGDRGYEDRFQMFVCRRDEEQVVRVEVAEIEKLIDQARAAPSSNAAMQSLAELLQVTLEEASYSRFITEIGAAAFVAFYDNSVASDRGGDFEATKKLHYPKYCVYRFASFLDLLRPGSVHWRGQSESRSMQLAEKGLQRFRSAPRDGRAFILSRWVENPGRNAFSERRTERQAGILQRRRFLISLQGLAAPVTAKRLDDAGFKPGRYPSFTYWQSLNPKSFASWLSRERTLAELLSPRRS
jgi:hypothetical protein